MVKNLPADAENVKRRRFGPWVGKIPWSGAWQPTPAFLPENPMDRGAWRAIVHGVAESQTGLRRLSSSSNISQRSRKGRKRKDLS